MLPNCIFLPPGMNVQDQPALDPASCNRPFASFTPDPDNPNTWREGFAKLSPSNPPYPGFRADEWREIHGHAKTFLETRSVEAAHRGWAGVDLFGVHDKVGASNVSACGALMLGVTLAAAEEITPDYIRLGRMRYFRMKMQSTVLVWRFGA